MDVKNVWKKFQVYFNDAFKGVVLVNSPVIKKVVSVSASAIIAVGSLSGCTMVPNEDLTVIEYNDFDNKDIEIEKKSQFVNDTLINLNNIYNSDGNRGAYLAYERINQEFMKYKSLENDISSENLYSSFYTDEDINDKKSQMLAALNTSIEIILNDVYAKDASPDLDGYFSKNKSSK